MTAIPTSDRCPCVDHIHELGVILRCILPAGHDGNHQADTLEQENTL